MAVPISQMWTVASYVIKQRLSGQNGTHWFLCWSHCSAATWRAPAAAKFSIPPTSSKRIYRRKSASARSRSAEPPWCLSPVANR